MDEVPLSPPTRSPPPAQVSISDKLTPLPFAQVLRSIAGRRKPPILKPETLTPKPEILAPNPEILTQQDISGTCVR